MPKKVWLYERKRNEWRHVIEGDAIDFGDNYKGKLKKTEPKDQVNWYNNLMMKT